MEIGPLVRRELVSVGPTHSLQQAAKQMAAHKVGCAVVLSDAAPGVISERDILRAIADGVDPAAATVADYMTWDAVVAEPSWNVHTAARTMIDGGFRHLVVIGDDSTEVGVLSIRDLVAALLGTT
jgi:CBS domain-containing protein